MSARGLLLYNSRERAAQGKKREIYDPNKVSHFIVESAVISTSVI